MKWILISLVLVCSLSATVLRWDDDQADGYLYTRSVCGYAVLFCDAPGDYMPGDTDGQEGVIRELRMMFGGFYPYDGDYMPEIFIYSRAEDDNPGEVLNGPLEYNRWEEGGWWRFFLDDPALVPGEFFVVVVKPYDENYAIYGDNTRDDWDIYHSRYRYWDDDPWRVTEDDTRIRVVWTPTGPNVAEASWGLIKVLVW
jgi:hypothetical protein